MPSPDPAPAIAAPPADATERPAGDPLAESITRVDRLVFRSSILAMATFRCPAADPLFRDSGPIRNAIFVFPRTSVRIQHEGKPSFVASPNLVTFYNAGQTYRRIPLAPEGDECDWYWIEPRTLAQVLARHDPASADSDRPFRFAWGPSDPKAYLGQRRAFLHAATSPEPDRLYLEETMIGILDRIVASALRSQAERERARPGRRRRHAALAEAAKQLLTLRATDPLDLSELSGALGCSPFHLCHVFRSQSGFTLSSYQHQIRLRRALGRVADPGTRLTDLAQELGYASHSHFTLFFRRAFGMTPSAFRARISDRPVISKE
jgi:AraC-like DNA-binding protein